MLDKFNSRPTKARQTSKGVREIKGDCAKKLGEDKNRQDKNRQDKNRQDKNRDIQKPVLEILILDRLPHSS